MGSANKSRSDSEWQQVWPVYFYVTKNAVLRRSFTRPAQEVKEARTICFAHSCIAVVSPIVYGPSFLWLYNCVREVRKITCVVKQLFLIARLGVAKLVMISDLGAVFRRSNRFGRQSLFFNAKSVVFAKFEAV